MGRATNDPERIRIHWYQILELIVLLLAIPWIAWCTWVLCVRLPELNDAARAHLHRLADR